MIQISKITHLSYSSDRNSIPSQEEEIENKLIISKLDTSIFNGWLEDITMSMESNKKATQKSGKGMWMVKNCDLGTFDTSILDKEVIDV